MKISLRIAALFCLEFAAIAQSAPTQSLPGHVPAAVARLQPLRHLETNRLKLTIALPLRDKEGLTNLLRQIYDPASPNYHHYLSAPQFAERFGPAADDYQTLQAFAAAHNLAVTDTHPNRTVLDVEGSVADIEKTLHTTMRVYRHPTEPRDFYAPDTEPSVDLNLPILHISGLDNFMVPHPLFHPTPAFAPTATGSGPGGNYVGTNFRAAYAPGVTLTGTGQTVGLLEFGSGFYQSDITAYETLAGLPNVTVTPVLLDGYDGSAGYGNVEVSLDIEMAISMAPGLSQVLVYEGESSDDILNRMATDNIAKQISASWAGYTDSGSDSIFLQYAMQGQSFFNACGDGDAWIGTIYPPCDDPNITIVGGTTLSTSGSGGAWSSETVWNWGSDPPGWLPGDQYVGGSGGISTVWSIPSWQTGISMVANHGSATMRNVPDVAMPANNIWVTFSNGFSGSVGGTSCAAPLWAGFIALVNQQAAANGETNQGFINPAIYALGKGASYTTCFHDITTGDNTWTNSPTNFYAISGYDLCTGWGTPNGSGLINALAPQQAAPAGATLYWDPGAKKASPGSGGTGNWGTGTADWWLSGTSNIAWNAGGDNPIFAGTAGTVTLNTAVSAGNLTFNTAGYTISGTTHTLTLTSPATISVPPPGTSPVNISCILSGAGYAVTGGGVLVLNNTSDSSVSPIAIVSNTTLVIAKSAAIGTGSGTVTISGGGTLQNNDTTSGDTFLSSSFNIVLGTGGGNLNDNGSSSLSYAGVISGSGSLTKTGGGGGTGGLLTLSGVNTYSGSTTISQGVLALSGSGSINNSPAIIIDAGASLNVSAIANWTLGGSTALRASGTGTTVGSTAATLKCASANGASLGSQPITLIFTPAATNGDTTHPALYVTLGVLTLSHGSTFTISNASSAALGVGQYTLIQQASGSISGTPSPTPVFSSGGAGVASGTVSSLSVSGGTMILTIARSTTTTLNTLSASTYGQSVTFTATVSPTPSGGTVQFYDNGVALGSAAAISGGTASYTTSTLAAGNHPITATYSGVTFYATSTTASASTQQVNKVALGITASAQSKVYGQTLTFGSGSTQFTSSGLQNSETVGSVTLAVSGNGGATNAPVGAYTITSSAATGGTFNAANYNITYNTNTLTVTLPPNTTPVTITNVTLLGNGTVQMNFTGTPGYVYTIEAATNLIPPISWTTLSTNAADSSGMFSFIDVTSTNYHGRYYQTVAQ